MTVDSFVYVVLLIVGVFCVAMFLCDVYEARATRRRPNLRQSGEYPHSNVKEQ